MRVYHSVESEPSSPDEETTTRAYWTLEDVLQDPQARAELLGRAINEAVAYRKRYSQLSELVLVIDGIDKTLANFDMKKAK